MIRRATRWRIGALLAVGAYGVHQGRYLLANGHEYDKALAESGHGYLAAVEPLIGLLLAFAVGQLIWHVAAGRRGGALPSRERRAPLFAAGLLLIFVGQELIEGVASEHACGLAGVFGAGGWIAVPLALVFGAGLALLVRGSEAALDRLVLAGALPRPLLRPIVRRLSLPSSLALPLHAVARHLAGRGPPLPVSY